MSLPFAYTFLTICLLSVTCAGWIARREGSSFGVAGGCLPFPYHLLTLSLPFAYYLLHVQDGEQDVRGAILGLLAVGTLLSEGFCIVSSGPHGGSTMGDRFCVRF